jgi:hypothetical protein
LLFKQEIISSRNYVLEEMSEDEVWNEVMRGGDDAGEAIKDQINEK